MRFQTRCLVLRRFVWSPSRCRCGRTIPTAATSTHSWTSRASSRKCIWSSPHSWIYIEVKDAKGEPQMWALKPPAASGSKELE